MNNISTISNSKFSPEKALQASSWATFTAVVLIALAAWSHDLGWHFNNLSTYQLFPLFGLLAFSIMWSHYMANALRQLFSQKMSVLSRYYKSTSFAVLALICLHPALLIIQRFRDGFGLPPGSYYSYVAPGNGWITLLGTASFFIFIAFEFRRRFGNRHWWKYVARASDFAMLAIFYHGLRLGGNLVTGWFRTVWFFYGITLVIVLIYLYYKRYTLSKKTALQAV